MSAAAGRPRLPTRSRPRAFRPGGRAAGRACASLNPARAFGPEFVSALGSGATHWNQLIPVYVLPGLAGSTLAAFAYDFLATPRRVAQPIEEAVTHPDPLATPDVAPSL